MWQYPRPHESRATQQKNAKHPATWSHCRICCLPQTRVLPRAGGTRCLSRGRRLSCSWVLCPPSHTRLSAHRKPNPPVKQPIRQGSHRPCCLPAGARGQQSWALSAPKQMCPHQERPAAAPPTAANTAKGRPVAANSKAKLQLERDGVLQTRRSCPPHHPLDLQPSHSLQHRPREMPSSDRSIAGPSLVGGLPLCRRLMPGTNPAKASPFSKPSQSRELPPPQMQPTQGTKTGEGKQLPSSGRHLGARPVKLLAGHLSPQASSLPTPSRPGLLDMMPGAAALYFLVPFAGCLAPHGADVGDRPCHQDKQRSSPRAHGKAGVVPLGVCISGDPPWPLLPEMHRQRVSSPEDGCCLLSWVKAV